MSYSLVYFAFPNKKEVALSMLIIIIIFVVVVVVVLLLLLLLRLVKPRAVEHRVMVQVLVASLSTRRLESAHVNPC